MLHYTKQPTWNTQSLTHTHCYIFTTSSISFWKYSASSMSRKRCTWVLPVTIESFFLGPCVICKSVKHVFITEWFTPASPINNIPSLVEIMAWRRPGDKPLSEPMMVSSLTHICITRPPWVNNISFSFSIGIVNTLRPGQNGRHFPDDIFKCIFLMEMYEFR